MTKCLVKCSAPAAAYARRWVIQHGEYRTGCAPQAWINFSGRNSFGRFQQCIPALGVIAELTIAVLRDFEAESHRPQVCHLAQELDRRLRIAAFELAISRAHSTDRLDFAISTLRHPAGLALPHAQQELIPSFAYTARANVISVLMRDHADAHVAVRINGEGLESAAAGVQGVRPGGRRHHAILDVLSMLGDDVGPIQ